MFPPSQFSYIYAGVHSLTNSVDRHFLNDMFYASWLLNLAKILNLV